VSKGKRQGLRWTRMYGPIVGGVTALVDRDGRGHRLHLRLDGRDGSWRVDRLCPVSLVWEAIDGGRGFSLERNAASLARRYADVWALATREGRPVEWDTREEREGA
jgi:hypothetical protein